MHKTFGKDGTCSFGDIFADKHTNRHAYHNTPLRYRRRSNNNSASLKACHHISSSNVVKMNVGIMCLSLVAVSATEERQDRRRGV